MKKTWHVSGNDYFIQDVTSQQPLLNPSVYNLCVTPLGALYLAKVSDKFTFDYKIYGMESNFITRVEKTFKSTKGNLGLLLNGIKGTGKTVTAEIIANKLNLPTILVGANYNGLNNFLMEITQDVVVLIDEYDKIFKGNIDEEDYNQEGDVRGDSTLLGLMDGTLKTEFRKVFILTTNRTWLNDNMLNRPGRIRYVKNFGDLELAQINEIIDDCLVDKKYRDDILAYLKPLKILTVDIVKAVISQVNIFDQYTGECCKDLNVEIKSEEYHIYKIGPGTKETLIDENPEIASVQNALNNKMWRHRHIYINDEPHYMVEKPDYQKSIFVVNENNSQKTKDAIKIRIKKVQPTHKVFAF